MSQAETEFMLFRDKRQERFAQPLTKGLREALDAGGTEWGLGTIPNIETDVLVDTEEGTLHVTAMEHGGRFDVVAWLSGLSPEDAAKVLSEGLVWIGGDGWRRP